MSVLYVSMQVRSEWKVPEVLKTDFLLRHANPPKSVNIGRVASAYGD